MMVKNSRLLILLGWLALPWVGLSQPNVDFQRANQAYESGNYEESLDQYEDILATHRHFESEFNAGNAAFKLNRLGLARLHYERAKLLSPSDEHLKANLALLESNIVDRITAVPSLGLKSWLASWVGPGQWLNWTLWALFWWTLTWVLWGLRWTKKNRDSRATLGFLGMASLALGVTGFWGISKCHERMETPGQVVVMSARVDVTSAPVESGTVLFQLHEGTRACILDRTEGWTEIELDNGNVGWLPDDAIADV
ncbi:tetratricopeptide repeat protein [Flavobacteriales bacterium]|nr:tetratricopeptide repeat protein [Flavobacteriales bacterium]